MCTCYFVTCIHGTYYMYILTYFDVYIHVRVYMDLNSKLGCPSRNTRSDLVYTLFIWQGAVSRVYTALGCFVYTLTVIHVYTILIFATIVEARCDCVVQQLGPKYSGCRIIKPCTRHID